jgi:hypothetical protein
MFAPRECRNDGSQTGVKWPRAFCRRAIPSFLSGTKRGDDSIDAVALKPASALRLRSEVLQEPRIVAHGDRRTVECHPAAVQHIGIVGHA